MSMKQGKGAAASGVGPALAETLPDVPVFTPGPLSTLPTLPVPWRACLAGRALPYSPEVAPDSLHSSPKGPCSSRGAALHSLSPRLCGSPRPCDRG